MLVLRKTFWVILGVFLFALLGGYLIPSGIFPVPASLQNQTTIRIFTRIAAISGGALVLGWLWTQFSLAGVLVRREARVLRHQVGQIFEERFRVINRLPVMRLWLEILDESELPGASGSRVLSLIGPRQQRTYVAYTLLNRRGAFRLGPTRISSGDPLGIFRKVVEIPGTQELIVLPYVANLHRFPSPLGQFPGGKAILQKATEVTPQAAGVREYLPGDALRSIHWPTSARKNRLMVKEFEQDPQADVWIILDAESRVHFSLSEKVAPPRIDQIWLRKNELVFNLPQDTFEYGVSAAGSIGAYYLKQGRSVGFICAGQAFVVLPAERGERQLNKILETLAFLKPNGNLPLLAVVDAEATQIPRASTIVLITPSIHPSMDLTIDTLLVRRMRPVLVHIDAHTFGANLSSEEFLERVSMKNIPVLRLRNNEPFTEALEMKAQPYYREA